MRPTGDDRDRLVDLLRADSDANRHADVADGGFTARVAAALPAPETPPRWRRKALSIRREVG